MSVTFTKDSKNLLLVHIKGTFTFEDLKGFQNSARAEIDRSGKVKLLILAEQFSGWGKEGDWGDLTFMYEHDAQIEKIAVVAEGKWKDQILMFVGAGKRHAVVEFFPDDGEENARDWLQRESE
ncbi:MAG: STAS/SEC14 domain-containing protein [Phycisphaerales bacterium]|nr:MAG: STAS/SEC14 domain-containing protein [Phycisphaerales bacterium]